MMELKINRVGINMAEDGIDHTCSISYSEGDNFTKVIMDKLVKKNYFPNMGQIIWEINTRIDKNVPLSSLPKTLLLGYIINIDKKWTVVSCCYNPKMSDIIEFCENNNASFKEISFSCKWVYNIEKK